MTSVMKIGIRDLVRNAKMLDNYDYLEIEDKKTHKHKGIFVSAKYSKEIKEYIDKKIAKEKKRQLAIIEKFAGSSEMEDRYRDLDGKELMAEVARAKSGV